MNLTVIWIIVERIWWTSSLYPRFTVIKLERMKNDFGTRVRVKPGVWTCAIRGRISMKRSQEILPHTRWWSQFAFLVESRFTRQDATRLRCLSFRLLRSRKFGFCEATKGRNLSSCIKRDPFGLITFREGRESVMLNILLTSHLLFK